MPQQDPARGRIEEMIRDSTVRTIMNTFHWPRVAFVRVYRELNKRGELQHGLVLRNDLRTVVVLDRSQRAAAGIGILKYEDVQQARRLQYGSTVELAEEGWVINENER